MKIIWLYLWNGWSDFVHVWHAARYYISANNAPLKQVTRATARAHVRSPPLYLRNYWADLFQIWHAVKYHTSACDAPLKSGVLLHVRTCTPLLCISEITGPIELKFGMRPSTKHR